MAARLAVRNFGRRLSTNGRVLSEEEKAAENVYIKKTEREKLEKLAHKGPKPEETAASSSGGSGSIPEAKPTAAASSSTDGVSSDKYRNYAVVAGLVTGLGALGWYLQSRGKKTEELQD